MTPENTSLTCRPGGPGTPGGPVSTPASLPVYTAGGPGSPRPPDCPCSPFCPLAPCRATSTVSSQRQLSLTNSVAIIISDVFQARGTRQEAELARAANKWKRIFENIFVQNSAVSYNMQFCTTTRGRKRNLAGTE